MGTAASVNAPADAKAKKAVRGKPVREWRIVNDGYLHTISFFHNLLSGSRCIAVDGFIHQETKMNFNLVGEIMFKLMGKNFVLEMKCPEHSHLDELLEYNLFVDGKAVETLGKHALWEPTTADGSPVTIIFEYKTFSIFCNNLPVDAHTGFGSDDSPGSTYRWTHGESAFLLQLYRSPDPSTEPKLVLSVDDIVQPRVGEDTGVVHVSAANVSVVDVSGAEAKARPGAQTGEPDSAQKGAPAATEAEASGNTSSSSSAPLWEKPSHAPEKELAALSTYLGGLLAKAGPGDATPRSVYQLTCAQKFDQKFDNDAWDSWFDAEIKMLKK